MKIELRDGAIQVEITEDVTVLVTVKPNPHHVFKGNILTRDNTGKMSILEFHGDGQGGTVYHGPEPFVKG